MRVISYQGGLYEDFCHQVGFMGFVSHQGGFMRVYPVRVAHMRVGSHRGDRYEGGLSSGWSL